MNIITKQKRLPKNKREWLDIQQPLDPKTGYANEQFDKEYGKKKNPWSGTERDRSKRKKYF